MRGRSQIAIISRAEQNNNTKQGWCSPRMGWQSCTKKQSEQGGRIKHRGIGHNHDDTPRELGGLEFELVPTEGEWPSELALSLLPRGRSCGGSEDFFAVKVGERSSTDPGGRKKSSSAGSYGEEDELICRHSTKMNRSETARRKRKGAQRVPIALEHPRF